MFFTVTVLVLIFGLGLTSRVLRRFAHSKSLFRGVFLKGLSAGNASIGSRVCSIGGALLLFVAGVVALNDGFFVLTAYRTTGTVDALVAVHDDEGSVNYAPQYRYRDGQGKEYSARSSVSHAGSMYKVGEQVPVLYSRFGINQSAINDYVHVWGDASALALLGTILLTVGCLRLYWPEISVHYQQAPPAKHGRQAVTQHLFRMTDNFFAMPGTLRFGVFACVALVCLWPFVLLTDSGAAGDELLEMAALTGIAFIIACGLLHRSRWVRPTVAFTSLVVFYNAFADRFWFIALIGFIAQVVMPIAYLYFNPAAKAYFHREKPTFNASERSSFEFSLNDSGGKDVLG